MNTSRTREADACVSREPIGLDSDRPLLARFYDAVLGGTDNYGVDRSLLTMLRASVPQVDFVFRSEVQFLAHAVRYIAGERGIEQFVVALPGLLPDRVDQLHDVARRCQHDARVWYIDYEPVVLAHLRARLNGVGGFVHVVEADPLDPATVWHRLAEHPSPPDEEPICLVLGGVLSFHPGSREDAAAVAQLHVAQLPPGSFIVLTHLLDPEIPELAPMVRRLHDGLDGSLWAGSVATRAQIRAMVAGTTILPPGHGQPPDVVPATMWWRNGPPVTYRGAAATPDPDSGQFVAAVVAAVDQHADSAPAG
ncbi:SAM-dependent methyltransferase [Amycolatopsis australiensis]|uniref:S-adenosyl methyltransferase n=1 Tax=Amycolatopsis australiensis TaxID=546364 RepID=A0A1K1RRF2_9PSEU|nr:SAM-dependent methyltransferase [Amycolatopsis australiensis]SFW74646.1 S-adenosyl methyltransferase [Amycolatopsis australiensis]